MRGDSKGPESGRRVTARMASWTAMAASQRRSCAPRGVRGSADLEEEVTAGVGFRVGGSRAGVMANRRFESDSCGHHATYVPFAIAREERDAFARLFCHLGRRALVTPASTVSDGLQASPPEATSWRAHIPALDSVRGLAVLAVMLLHFTMLIPGSVLAHVFVEVVEIGWAGVDLFFVLSGFLITGVLLGARGGPGFFRNFYARRTLRIFPLYYAFLFALFVVWPLLIGGAAEPRGPMLLTLAYLNNFLFALGGWDAVPGHTTHLWSLAIEEQFYLLWPLVVFWVSRRVLIRVCWSLLAAAWFIRIALFWRWPTGLPGYALLPARVDALAAGAVLAALVREPGWSVRLRPWVPRLLLMGFGLLLLNEVIGIGRAEAEHFLTPLYLRVQLLAFPAVAMLSVALVLTAVLPRHATAPLVWDREVLRRLGKFSYAMYLFHVPIRNVMRDHVFVDGVFPPLLGSTLLTQTLATAAAILSTYVLAFMSWHLFERHFLQLKRYFEYRRVDHASRPMQEPVLATVGERPI